MNALKSIIDHLDRVAARRAAKAPVKRRRAWRWRRPAAVVSAAGLAAAAAVPVAALAAPSQPAVPVLAWRSCYGEFQCAPVSRRRASGRYMGAHLGPVRRALRRPGRPSDRPRHHGGSDGPNPRDPRIYPGLARLAYARSGPFGLEFTTSPSKPAPASEREGLSSFLDRQRDILVRKIEGE